VLRGCEVAPVTAALARAAGVACGATGAHTLDAIIAATAAARGATLLTADVSDMHPLADHFRSLRVVAL
jgi:predicted nucleic acid-binding protein